MLRNNKQKFIFALIIIINFIASGFTSLNAQWAGWAWRREVTITNSSGTELTDFQVKVDLGNLTPSFNFAFTKSDGSDLRVTSSNGITQIPFWIEEWDTSSHKAVLWVKLPTIPLNGTTLYLYYGNPIAAGQTNGTNTFEFFDDFSNYDVVSGQNWVSKLDFIGGDWGPTFVGHDWKNSSEFVHGALEYASRNRSDNWNLESLDIQLEQEFDFVHSQINPNGTVIPDSTLNAEPQYCYGLILSNLAVGYWYFISYNPALAYRCYDDMVLVFDYVKAVYPTITNISDAGGYSWLQVGFSNAWTSLNDQGDVVRAAEISTITQNYAATFLSNQNVDGSWIGATNVEEQLKRDIGVLWAEWVVHENPSLHSTYLTAVSNNIEYILDTYWVSSNGGLEWGSNPNTSDRFFEYNQVLFMIAARRLNGRSGGSFDYTAQSLLALHFLTDNNYAGIDMYIHNFLNHNSFFSYRDVQEDGTFQDVDLWKGSNEIGAALWAMALNYDWVSNYQSSHSPQAFNYLDMLVGQIKNSPANEGYFEPGTFKPNSTFWATVSNPDVNIVQDGGNYVSSFIGSGSNNDYIKSVQNFDNFILEMKVDMTVDASDNCTPEVGFRVIDNDNRYVTILHGETENDLTISRYQGGVLTNPSTFPTYNFTEDTYYKYKIVANGTTIEQHLNDALVRAWSDAGSTVTNGGISLTNFGGTTTNPVYFDDVRVRKYASVEPIATVSTEESNPLPVELNSFSASVSGSAIKLNWMTETEINNYGFEIYRFAENDKNGWTKIGFVQGNGNSNSPKYYSFEDENLIAGKYSYRLKQIDTDGQFEYSKVVEVNLGSPMKYELSQNYPNPFNPVTTIRYSIPESGEVHLTVYTILGEEVAELVNGVKEAGVYTVNFNASELNSGLHIYKLSVGNFSEAKKLMVIK